MPSRRAKTDSMNLISICLSLAALSINTCAAEIPSVFSSQYLYDWGLHGLYPSDGFRSVSNKVPRVNFLKWDQRCMNGYYFIAPKGRLVDHQGPYILDGRGNLVWSGEEHGPVADFQSQTYKGKQYLTMWKNTDGLTMGWGRGVHIMLDENYQIFKEIHPMGEGMMGDLHEFHITSNDTALISAYRPRTWDLSSIGGPEDGWIMDSVFQELDIETGELLFEWRASDHVPVEDTVRYFAGRDTGLTPERGFDYFHVNSMDKDKEGNYLVSGRHTHTIHSIAPNGTLRWTLGGKRSDFQDLSEGRASDFAYQHHIRINDDDVISMFDNAKSERSGPALPYDYSRGLVIQLDQKNLTAELLHEVYNSDSPWHADSQGSAQLWDNDRAMVVNYGWYPAVTEFDVETSEVLCDMHFGPSLLFPFGFIGSYRGFKGTWTGKPTRRPNVLMAPKENALFVSWNGATEVAQWVLQGADWGDFENGSKWLNLDSLAPEGQFESQFDIDDSMPQYLRAVALDKNGAVLMHSQTVSRTLGSVPPAEPVNILFEWLGFMLKWALIGSALWAWDWCRPVRACIWRLVVKAWLVVKPRFRRFCFCFVPKNSKAMLRLPEWGPKGKQHELQPLYSSEADDQMR